MPWSSKARIMAANQDRREQVEEFHYPPVLPPAGAADGPEQKNGANEAVRGIELLFSESFGAGGTARCPTNKDLEDRARQGFEAGRQKGITEGQAQARVEFEKALAAEKAKLARALEEFAQETRAYYRSVEPEVVRLALAIARKVLHRELQIDALALTGIVRVTLEKLAAGCVVKLRVPSAQAARWQNAFPPQHFPDLHLEVVPDDLLDAPQCRVETEAATTDLSVDAQLDEIERGFLDLLDLRPGRRTDGDVGTEAAASQESPAAANSRGSAPAVSAKTVQSGSSTRGAISDAT